MGFIGRRVEVGAAPEGLPTVADFRLTEIETPDPGEGELVVRNHWMSVDPALRMRLSAGGVGKLAGLGPGDPLDGMAVGTVVASSSDRASVGAWVLHSQGWRHYALIDPENPAHRFSLLPEDAAEPRRYLGLLGLIGFTARVGLTHVAHTQPGETVWVSAAAGAVGSIAVQLAKLNGNRVIASAGGADKTAYVRDVLGADVVFDYRSGPVGELLPQAAPEGIDVYFDNVGSDHLEAALYALKLRGRVALCGQVSTYNASDPVPGPSNLFQAIAKNLTMTGFLAVQYAEHMPAFISEMSQLVAEDKIRYDETIGVGLEQAPATFIDMFEGRTRGKAIVDLRGDQPH